MISAPLTGKRRDPDSGSETSDLAEARCHCALDGDLDGDSARGLRHSSREQKEAQASDIQYCELQNAQQALGLRFPSRKHKKISSKLPLARTATKWTVKDCFCSAPSCICLTDANTLL